MGGRPAALMLFGFVRGGRRCLRRPTPRRAGGNLGPRLSRATQSRFQLPLVDVRTSAGGRGRLPDGSRTSLLVQSASRTTWIAVTPLWHPPVVGWARLSDRKPEEPASRQRTTRARPNGGRWRRVRPVQSDALSAVRSPSSLANQVGLCGPTQLVASPFGLRTHKLPRRRTRGGWFLWLASSQTVTTFSLRSVLK